MSTSYVFLSYNREDADIARTYAEALEREGLEVWWDATLRSGEAYDEVTEAALRAAKAVVVLWSPRSVVSRWVRAEATIGERARTLMPVTIEPCDRPVMFELTQTADLSHWRGDAEDKAWLAFVGDVRRKVGSSEERPAKAGVDRAPAPPAAPARGGPSFVAVLPLTHRAGDEDLEILAEDLTEEVTRELAQNSFFNVIAAGRVSAWRGRAVDYSALGRELDARYLIEGKLQRAGEDMRLTVQLIDSTTGSMLWSRRFSCKLADIALSPEQFPVAVSGELGEHIVQIEMSRALAKTGPCSGWDHVLRARSYEARVGSDSILRIIEEARHAVVAAPDLGLAHAMLAQALAGSIAVEGKVPDDILTREIQTHARRAAQLDGDNYAVINCLVTVYSADGETSLRLARRLVQLRPNSSNSLFRLGTAYLDLGLTADAIGAFLDYERLTETDHHRLVALYCLGNCYFLEGQLEAAGAALNRSLALHPDFHLSLKWKAIVAAARGDEPTALAAIRRHKQVEPSMSLDQAVEQMSNNPKLAERSSEAVAILRRLWAATEAAA